MQQFGDWLRQPVEVVERGLAEQGCGQAGKEEEGGEGCGDDQEAAEGRGEVDGFGVGQVAKPAEQGCRGPVEEG